MYLNHSSCANGHRGFSMVEVLVTMVIIAFGLLGVAGLLTTGLRNNQSSELRSQASILAYDMAERMRANHPAVVNGDYATTASPNGIALSDRTAWNAALAAKLPSGTGTITTSTASNLVLYQIKIQWADSKVSSTSDSNRDTLSGAAPSAGTSEFILRGEL